MYTYGAKCDSVREIGPSGMFSTGALLYGVLHNADPNTPVPLADISMTVLEDMSAETNNFSYLAGKYPNVNYNWTRKPRPDHEDYRADIYFVPIWHLSENGIDLFENSRNGTASLADRFKEFGEYTNKYLIIHEQNVINIMDKMPMPDEPLPQSRRTKTKRNYLHRSNGGSRNPIESSNRDNTRKHLDNNPKICSRKSVVVSCKT